MLNVDALAQEIRRVDGEHKLGAGALAEALMPFLSARAMQAAGAGKKVAMIGHLDHGKTSVAAAVALVLGSPATPAGPQEGAEDLVPVSITNIRTGETRSAHVDRSQGVVVEPTHTPAPAADVAGLLAGLRARSNHDRWDSLCEGAADAIEALQAEVASQKARADDMHRRAQQAEAPAMAARDVANKMWKFVWKAGERYHKQHASAKAAEAERDALRAEVDRSALPADVVEHLLKIGAAEWGSTKPQTAEEHGADTANSVRITAENFGQKEPQPMHGLYCAGSATVICHTGTSPNSGQTARILTGLWNHAVQRAKENHAAEGA